MRYLVRAYTTHEAEEGVAHGLVDQLEDAETFGGYIQGVADEATIRKLVDSGLSVSALSEVQVAPPAVTAAARALPMSAGIGVTAGFESLAVAPEPPAAAGGTDPEYVLLRMPGALSAQRRGQLEAAGAKVIERESGDWYVARAADPAAVQSMGFVQEVRPYGVEETLSPRTLEPDANSALSRLRTGPAGAKILEATVHADADRTEVASRIEALGGHLISGSGRVCRFAMGDADPVAVADIPEVANLQEVTIAQTYADAARRLIGLEDPADVGHRLLPYDGSDEIVGVADTGLDDQHEDFDGRIVGLVAMGRPADASDPDGHGTHVAGTIVGDGKKSNGVLAGIAPKAKLYFQSVMDINGGLRGLPANLKNLFQPAYDNGVRVHNNSWGAYVHARYSANSLEVDDFVYRRPDFLPVIAAGNNGSCLPGMGASQGFVDYPSLGAPATAKNALTVGASRSDRTAGGYSKATWGQLWSKKFTHDPIKSETVSGNHQGLAAFSSRGPCDDRRIKPDVVAPGTDIAATKSRNAPLRNFWGAYPGNPSYAFMGGTSMACPIVAGCAALVRQFYVKERNHPPSAALLKATLINGTGELSHVDSKADPQGLPNYHQGFGRIDMRRTLPNSSQPGMRLVFVDTYLNPAQQFQEAGQIVKWDLVLDADGDLAICLAWTDPPARGLQNTLMATLDNGALQKKWFSNDRVAGQLKFPTPASLAGAANFQRDPDNNVHIIRVPGATAGVYRLAVIADNILFPPQSFALVATGPIASLNPR